jgi:hypothetical protein
VIPGRPVDYVYVFVRAKTAGSQGFYGGFSALLCGGILNVNSGMASMTMTLTPD